jgi:hypothetical protein
MKPNSLLKTTLVALFAFLISVSDVCAEPLKIHSFGDLVNTLESRGKHVNFDVDKSIYTRSTEATGDSLEKLVEQAHSEYGFDFEARGDTYYIVDHTVLTQGARVSTNRQVSQINLDGKSASEALSILINFGLPTQISEGKEPLSPGKRLKFSGPTKADDSFNYRCILSQSVPCLFFLRDAKIDSHLDSKTVSISTDVPVRLGDLLWKLSDQAELDFHIITTLNPNGKGSYSSLTVTRRA